MTDPDQVAAALHGTSLAGLPVAHGPDGTLLVPGVDPAGLLEAWEAAHALVPLIGRWPVLVTTDFDDRWSPEEEPQPMRPAEPNLADLDRAARSLDPWPFFQKSFGEEVTADSARYFGQELGVDLVDRLERQVTFPAPRSVVQRWMFEQVSEDPQLVAQLRQQGRYVVETDYWYAPEEVTMLLLPTASPWLAPAWVDFYRTAGHIRELAAALWQWHHRWDAHLVACWDTMLQLLVHRPPEPGESAFELAGQLLAVATHLEMHQWALATVLPDSTAWFLHSRP